MNDISGNGICRNGLCGWFGNWSESRPGEDALGGLVAAFGGAKVISADFCAAVVGGPADDLLHADDEIVVALADRTTLGGAAALAAAYRRDGESALGAVHGPFALVLLDRRCARLLLVIDRAGARPLYVNERNGAVFFASRLEMLARMPGFHAELDDQAIFDYVYFHMIPSPRAIYRDVFKLLPAQVCAWEQGESSARFYWHMPYRDATAASFDQLKQEFRALLPRVVGDAVGGAESAGKRVGCFLSGGTDSSSVAGTWRQVRGEPVPTYSIGFDAAGFDEMDYARIAARHFRTDPREYYVTAADVVDSIPRIAAYCDEPFGNASIVPAYLCARYARQDGIDILLAGDGGDEIFAGNERYAHQWLFELYGRVPAPVRLLLERAVRVPGLGTSPLLRKARSYLDQAKVPLPDRFETYNFLQRTALEEIFEPAFLARVDTEAPLRNLREVYARSASDAVVNRMMHLDLKITLADNDLRKVNLACELAGVDVRYPLLEDRMLEFAASVPPNMQLKGRRLRWFFKQALADFLPAEIIAKRKHGFGLPVGLWMKDYAPLRDLIHDSVDALGARGIVRPRYVDWIEQKHANEHASYYGVMLWVLAMLEQWMQAHRA